MSNYFHWAHNAHQLFEHAKKEGGVKGAGFGALAGAGAAVAVATFLTAPITLPLLGLGVTAGALYGSVKEEHPKKK